MVSDTKERILKTALELFAQKGYLGTSMSDIAEKLGITKGALYKHYTGKQEILNRIIEKMNEMDAERAKLYNMPDGRSHDYAEAYNHTSVEKIRAYSVAQFIHWTEDEFSSCFRKMLMIEQHRDPDLARLYQNYLAIGPVDYITLIFKEMTDSDEESKQLALDFYGPMYLLYSVYDGSDSKETVVKMLEDHIDRFIDRMQSERGKAASE